MSKHIIHYNGYDYDSLPEATFAAWCEEALQLNIIRDYWRQPVWQLTPAYYNFVKVQLKTKEKIVKRTLLKPSTYSADFNIVSNVWLEGLVADRSNVRDYETEPVIYVIDVKGESNNTNAKGLFSLKQKMLMYTNGVYVNKVIPGEFFVANGWPSKLPEECYMKQGGLYAWLRKYQDKSAKTVGEVFV